MTDCVFCNGDGGPVLWRDEFSRIVRASIDGYPGFLRVILHRHVCEMTDLDEAARERLMRTVWVAESVLREVYRPDKVNLASFGNMVAHLHWHVIARYHDDPHFPDPSWGTPHRGAPPPRTAANDEQLRAHLQARLG